MFFPKMKKLYHVYIIIFLLYLSATETTIAAQRYAKNMCKDKCGSVLIPYPFGIGANCSINEWYAVDCNSSKPYLSKLPDYQVLYVDLQNQTVIVNTPMIISDCNQTNNVNLGRSPFFFSKSQNKFVYEGCGNAIIMDHGGSLTGCSTTCSNDSFSDKNNCLGISCCEIAIPHHLKSYNMNLMGLERLGGDSGCGFARLINRDSTLEGRFSIGHDKSYFPQSLLWTLSDTDHEQESCCYTRSRVLVDLGYGTTMDSWKCIYISEYMETVEGTPYLRDGCQDTEECAKCRESGGSCSYVSIYNDINDLVAKNSFNCTYSQEYNQESKSSVAAILGVSITMGVLFLVATSYVLYKLIEKTKETGRRKKFFKRNGGLVLKQQEGADPSLVNKTIHFTSRELEKATDNFNDNRILGRGGQGTVYKGMLVDGRIVAVKKSKIIDESQLEQFINEVVILSQVNHRNVVKLLGCCLETEVPLLVSEFIPNGTLYDLLQNGANDFPLSFYMRIQIATEIGGALAYLHSATSIPIYHRDIKTSNILLDDKYRAKVSDFGTSRFVSLDQTHLTTLVKGTFGYFDPEYFRSNQFTEKSDVYSFGVVLVELLTREKPISLTRFGEHRSLATHFLLAMEEGCVMSIFDVAVIKEGTRNDLLELANLAAQCLNLNGKYRPTMKEVAIALETIRASHVGSN